MGRTQLWAMAADLVVVMVAKVFALAALWNLCAVVVVPLVVRVAAVVEVDMLVRADLFVVMDMVVVVDLLVVVARVVPQDMVVVDLLVVVAMACATVVALQAPAAAGGCRPGAKTAEARFRGDTPIGIRVGRWRSETETAAVCVAPYKTSNLAKPMAHHHQHRLVHKPVRPL